MKNNTLTPEENAERDRLLELQSSNTRWFRQHEFDRLKYLSNKLYNYEKPGRGKDE